MQIAATWFLLCKVFRDMFSWPQDSTLQLAIVLHEAHRVAKDVTLPKPMKGGRKYGVVVGRQPRLPIGCAKPNLEAIPVFRDVDPSFYRPCAAAPSPTYGCSHPSQSIPRAAENDPRARQTTGARHNRAPNHLHEDPPRSTPPALLPASHGVLRSSAPCRVSEQPPKTPPGPRRLTVAALDAGVALPLSESLQ